MNMVIKKEEIKELKKLYKNAVENEEETFMFKGELLLTSYAKYLIEYIDISIKKK